MSQGIHIIGIDPGVSGGVAVLTLGGRIVQTANMPESDRDLLDLLQPYAMSAKAYLETIHAMPPTIRGKKVGGSVGNFKLGQSDGRLCLALTAVCIPYDRVSPLKWQTAMQCRTEGDKNVTRRRAQTLFPAHKITHAIADALLIAEWGRRQNPLLEATQS